MPSEARIDLNIDHEIAALSLELGFLAERGAEAIAEEVRAVIELSDIPAEAGSPPHSMGPYRDSWKFGKAKRRRGAITAYAFSMATSANGDESLAEILEEGRGPIHPHPHWRAGLARARKTLEQMIDSLNAKLRAGG